MKVRISGYSNIKHGPNHTHVFDFEGYKMYQEKIQSGIDLFAKHFQRLWT